LRFNFTALQDFQDLQDEDRYYWITELYHRPRSDNERVEIPFQLKTIIKMKKNFLSLAAALMLAATTQAEAMSISIANTGSAGNLELEVVSTDRIEDVKTKIFDQTAIPASLQVLFYADKKLEDGNTLQNYSVQPDYTLQLYVRNASGIAYVVPNGTGDGSSWSCPLADMQQAINISGTNDEVWVAAGTYKPTRTAAGWNSSTNRSTNSYPTTDGTRDNAFVLKEGVRIYGGFAGTETSIAQRQFPSSGGAGVVNATILSGDIGTENDNTDNAHHVVIGAGNITVATILDGFTITGGNADGSGSISVNGQSIAGDYGGGIYNASSSPTLTNVTISENTTASDGGGIYNYNYSSPTLTNVTISGNTAGEYGGGIENNSSSPTLINVTISGNSTSYGGGIENYNSSPTLTNVTISGNTANNNGGGIYNNYYSSPTLANLTISGNKANNGGGGIYNDFYSSDRKSTRLNSSH
jgi:parallel beta-helix repeat protein